MRADGRAYYNEIDPFAAQWLRNLIDAGHIAPGDVDERSIVDVGANDLAGYTQCHFFAGIGGWSLALRLAGWPDDRKCWTGSCPCQPFSAAGKGAGFDDARHLWPNWFDLIGECRPPVIFGEQVASAVAVGRANPYLPEMQDREAVLAVLRELEGQSPSRLYGLRASGRAAPEAVAARGGNRRPPEGVAGRQPGARAGQRGEAPGANTESAMHAGPDGHPGADRCWQVRDDRHSFRPDRAAGVERALPRSDRAGEGLHAGQCAGGSLFPECDGEHMGTAADSRDSECDFSEAPGEIGRVFESLGGKIEGPDERTWIDAVRSDLGRAGYAVGMVVAPSAGFGAPHIRQRLGFVADADQQGQGGRRVQRPGQGNGTGAGTARERPSGLRADGGLADPHDARSQGRGGMPERADQCAVGALGMAGGLADATDSRREPFAIWAGGSAEEVRDDTVSKPGVDSPAGGPCRPGPTNGPWGDADWLLCRDGKWRPVEPGTFPLAHGISGRVGRLRAFGNAINPHQFKALIEAYCDTLLPGVKP